MRISRTRGVERIRVQTKVSAAMHEKILGVAEGETDENISHAVRVLLQEALLARELKESRPQLRK